MLRQAPSATNSTTGECAVTPFALALSLAVWAYKLFRPHRHPSIVQTHVQIQVRLAVCYFYIHVSELEIYVGISKLQAVILNPNKNYFG